jgi:hypothetical protein
MLNYDPKVKADAAHNVCIRQDKTADKACQDPIYLARHEIAVKNNPIKKIDINNITVY